MGGLVDIILPVFLVIGVGFGAARGKVLAEEGFSSLMTYAHNFAIPALLFSAIARIDLGTNFDRGLMASYYLGVLGAALLGALGARFLFRRPPEDSVAIGFGSAFSNSLLLGLPITERAYGADALSYNFALISVHAPVLYTGGIITMEVVRNRGGRISPEVLLRILKSIATNVLVLALAAGALVNLSGLTVPQPIWSTLEMLSRSALPVALFALGGTLARYRPEGDLRVALYIVFASLLVHPAITYVLGARVFDIGVGPLRSAVIAGAMAPGINSYIFANMYGAARRVAATALLIGTGLSIVTVSFWIYVLP